MDDNSAQEPNYPILQRNKDEIRILEILPGTWEQDIEVELKTTRLSTEPEYEALSYTWDPPIDGQELPDQNIWVSGQMKAIKGNLFNALKRLRYESSIRRVWIDALCINQQNNDERSHQVSIMARIYRQATGVLVWLGEDSEYLDGELAFAFYQTLLILGGKVTDVLSNAMARLTTLDELDRHCLELLSYPGVPFSSLRNSDRWGKIVAKPCPDKSGSGGRQEQQAKRDLIACIVWERLFFFFERRYFKRRWVVQELFHAPAATALCGRYAMNWHNFVDMTEWLFRAYRWVGRMRFPKPQTLIHPEALLLSINQLKHTESKAMRLLELLVIFSSAQCRDVRDTVFALLSLDDTPCLEPDYSLSVSEVWTKLACLCVEDGWVGTMIDQASRQIDMYPWGRTTDLPSWVPDFGLELSGSWKARESQIVSNEVDEWNRLHCTLHYLGEVGHSYTRVGTKIVDFVIHKVNNKRPGKNGTAHEVEPMSIGSIINFDIHEGDIVCRLGDGPAGVKLLALRPTQSRNASDSLQTYTILGTGVSWKYAGNRALGPLPVGEMRRFVII